MKTSTLRGAEHPAWAMEGRVRKGAPRPVFFWKYLGKSNWVSVWPPYPTNSSVKLDFYSVKWATHELVFPGSRKEGRKGGGSGPKNK